MMSGKEAARPGLVKAALAGKVSNRELAAALRLSVRQVQRLKAAFRRKGVRALIHQGRGRLSPRRLSRGLVRRVAQLVQTRYAGLSDCHLTEKLREIEKLDLCRESVRRIRLGLGIPAQRRHRAPKHRARRLREARLGALVQVDGSPYAWFGDNQPLSCLIGAVDDATGALLGLTFRPHEDLHGYALVLREVCRSYGVPLAWYGDGSSVLVRNDRSWSLEEQLRGRRDPTQLGHMLAELGIAYIRARCPQGKGRVENRWATLQDRLVSELRLRGIRSLQEANVYLPAFRLDFNRRFARAARESNPAWRPAPRHLDLILACRYTRTVARDNTVSIPGRWIQIPRGRRSYAGLKVEIRECLDGRLLALYQGAVIARQTPPDDFVLVSRRGGPARRASLGLDQPPREVRSKPKKKPLEQLYRKSSSHRPTPVHPWRRGLPAWQPGFNDDEGDDIFT